MKKEEKPGLDWLLDYRAAQPNFGLERMEKILALRGNPHLKLSVIHLAGTNGKGSTIAYLRQLLKTSGLRVGTFTSPYLVSYNEQIAIDGLAISNQDLNELLLTYQELFEQDGDDPSLQGATEFEIMTALAYDYFAQKKVDVALIEVGMGGLLDSTNVCQPELTAITTIGLDHTALLGSTLAAIAEQKAGIIKENVPVVTGKLPAEALTVVERIAQEKSAQLLSYGQAYQSAWQASLPQGERFCFSNETRKKELFETPLLGLHQVDNAALALELCDQYCRLKKLSLLTKSQVQEALSATTWAGRMERICPKPLIFLDGAHNPQAMETLLATLKERYGDFHKQVLFTCIETKAVDEMLAQLRQLKGSQLTLTSFSDARAISRQKMQQLAEKESLPYKDWQAFLEEYLGQEQPKAEVLVITGSLYFLAQVRHFLLTKLEDKQE